MQNDRVPIRSVEGIGGRCVNCGNLLVRDWNRLNSPCQILGGWQCNPCEPPSAEV